MEEWLGFLYRTSKRWPLLQPFEIRCDARILAIERNIAGSIPKRRRRGAIGETESVADGELALAELRLDHVIGRADEPARLLDALLVALALGPQAVGDDLANRSDVVVAHAVPAAQSARGQDSERQDIL